VRVGTLQLANPILADGGAFGNGDEFDPMVDIPL
jgi:hypothetical protein